MKAEKKAKLEAAGFRVGTVAEFLELKSEENEMLELRVALAKLVRELRKREEVTQEQLAEKMSSDQGRISRLENNDPSVSVDQMLEAAFSLGAKRRDILEVLAA
jgi:ribosome-binding protein aMBF1 (putative translation factor)